MELSEKQELYVSRYIHEIEEHIGDQLSLKQRERALARLRARIDEKLKSSSAPSLEDGEVLNVLHKLGQAETQAAILVRVWGDAMDVSPSATVSSQAVAAKENPAGQSSPPAEREVRAAGKPDSPSKKKTRGPVWLGVLHYTAARFSLPLWVLRLLVLLAGLATGPIALILYMLMFIVLRIQGCVRAPAPFHPFRVALYPLLTAGMLTLLYSGGIYGLEGIRMAHEKYLHRPVPELNEWAWLQMEALNMFLGALIFLLPLALFSAMPLANAWDYSLRRLAQAGVALYAIIVSFGLASFVTGIILNFVHEFA